MALHKIFSVSKKFKKTGEKLKGNWPSQAH